jgi:hypothetical protein
MTPGDEIERSIARLRARLGPARLEALLCWLATQSDAELAEYALELDDAGRLELLAWVMALRGHRP